MPAQATLTFRYATREAWIEPLSEADPQAYDLCQQHAARTTPPNGWQLRDQRPQEDREVHPAPTTPDDLGGESTVAVLAAALQAVPDAAVEDAVRDPAPEVIRDAEVVRDADPAPPDEVAAPRPVLAVREPGVGEPGGRATRW